MLPKCFVCWVTCLLIDQLWLLLSTGRQKLDETGQKISCSTSEYCIEPVENGVSLVTTSRYDVRTASVWIEGFLKTFLTLIHFRDNNVINITS